MKNPEKSGTWGWAAIGVGVVAWDTLAPETLSGAVDRGLENKKTRYIVMGGVAVTAAHLLNLLPEQYDPFSQVVKYLRHE